MAYQALYRAWRPEKFEDVVGQDTIIKTLVSQIETGRIAHAYLFCGSRGTGKTSTAKILARAINCQKPLPGAEPCGICEACVAIREDRAMDVVEIDAASNNGVDEIRDLREKIQYPPSVGRYKVYIVDEVHMLSAGAFNALLKTLEEPPEHAVFILATTEPQKLPATILSRCQRFDFRRIPAKLIEARLAKVLEASGAKADPEAVSLIARAAEGGMRDALSILDTCIAEGTLTAGRVREVLGASGRETLYDFASAVIASDAGRALTLIAQAVESGRDPAVFAREATGYFRALLLAQAVGDGLADLIESTEEEAGRLREQAKPVSTDALMRWMELFMRAESDMKWMSQPRSALELCAARCCRPELETSFEALSERIAKLEEKLKNLAALPFEPTSAPKAEDARPAEAPAPPKRAPQHKPQPAEKAAGPGPAPDGETEYREALQHLEKEQPALFGMLRSAVFRGIDGSSALIELPRERAFFKTILENKRTLIDAALEKAFGRPVSFKFAQPGETAKPVSPRTLEQAYDIFGREHVSVLDE